jgi:RimJ/RimL family protein N-acetyltransferase
MKRSKGERLSMLHPAPSVSDLTLSRPQHATLIPVPGEIRSPRLVLRPFQERDAGQLLAAIEESREHLAPWLAWPPNIQTLDDARDLCLRWAARWTLRTDLGFGIFEAEDGRFLGAIGLHDPNWGLRSFEIGYWLRTSPAGACPNASASSWKATCAMPGSILSATCATRSSSPRSRRNT